MLYVRNVECWRMDKNLEKIERTKYCWIKYIILKLNLFFYRDCGTMCFLTHVQEKLWARVEQEFPFLIEETKACRCKVRRRSSRRSNSKSGVNSSR